MPAQVDRFIRIRQAGLMAGLAGAMCLFSCDKDHTGFIITVEPPNATSKPPGVAYNELSVDVTADGDEQSTVIPITAAMGNVPSEPTAPYVVIVLFDDQLHTQAQSMDVALKLNNTTIASYILPPQPITLHQLTPVTVDMSMQ